MPYKFFFSYSRRDAKGNPYLKEFHRRLALEVGQAAGVSAAVDEADIGFFDTEGIEPGEKWPDKLAGALQSSKVFVCLYSNGYFKSEWCGKEFEVFRSRVAAYTPPSGRPAPRLIIPVLWDRRARLPEPLPDAVTDLQYTHADFGAKYEVEGLAYFMKLKSKANEAFVTRFIINLAEHI
ncbi:MAG TPA: TIR-like protein FxsC, partial [Pyrinomonadaceae bacterium]